MIRLIMAGIISWIVYACVSTIYTVCEIYYDFKEWRERCQ